MSTFEIKMPKLGESITEGTIVSWSVKVGDAVQEDDVLFEVSTAKVSAEIPSPVAGKVLELLFSEGDTVAVGTTVALIQLEGEEGEAPESTTPAAAKSDESTMVQSVPAEPAQPVKSSKEEDGRWYSPIVLKLAQEAKISQAELDAIPGTGYEGRLSKKDIKDRIKYLNKTFDMESFLYQRIGTLSTGQTQRVSIARCLMHDPKYYILDEPTSGLDIISSKVILDTIKEEKDKGKCILYSTHYMEEAESICDRVVLMNNGKIITIGTPEEIKKKTNTSNLREAFFALTGGDNYE